MAIGDSIKQAVAWFVLLAAPEVIAEMFCENRRFVGWLKPRGWFL
jgi:hypothetical protein